MINYLCYRKLADGIPESAESISPDFVMHREKDLCVAWAPFDHINTKARIAVIGITPGWQQAQIAYISAQESLKKGLTYSTACKLAKEKASFAGTMRKHLISMLDKIGVAKHLNIDSTADLFDGQHKDLHTTSALRYPVFRNNNNYSGHTPAPLKNTYLRRMVESLLVEEIKAIPSALFVPLGKAANICVKHAMAISRIDITILDQFPHPSGANAHRMQQFKEQKRALSKAVNEWGRLKM